MSSENVIIERLPPHGAKDAINKGCTCPVIDNYYGKGFMLRGERVFWFNAGCCLHGAKEDAQISPETRDR